MAALPGSHPDRSPSHEGEIEVFATHTGALVDLEFINGSLYLLDIWNGTITQVYPTEVTNQPPIPVLSANISQGPPPLLVTFSAAGTFDPDDTALLYRWEFGDATPAITTTAVTITHTYQAEGTFTARLVVSDIRGTVSAPVELSISVYAGEYPTIKLENLGTPGRLTFHGGDQFRYTAVRSTLDGLDPLTPFTWRIDLQHNEHYHPILANHAVISDVFQVPAENHGDLNIAYRFTLEMLTQDGIRITLAQEIHPALTTLEIRTFPGTGVVQINQVGRVSPFIEPAIIGVDQVLEAPAEVIHGTRVGRFAYWEVFDGWGRSLQRVEDRRLEFPAPEFPGLYIAYYVNDRPANLVYLPLLRH